jgi:hypothetical protein
MAVFGPAGRARADPRKIWALSHVLKTFTEVELRQEETRMTDIAVEQPKRIHRRHPNASRALMHGSGLGAIIVWSAGLTGLEMPPEIAAVLAGAVASAFLLIGKRGIKGTIHDLWNGSDG